MKIPTPTRSGRNLNPLLWIVPFAALVLLTSTNAAEMVRYKARALGSKVLINGSANIHDWTMEGTLITGFFEVPAGVEFDQSKTTLSGVTTGKLAARAETSIPVTSLNGSLSGMNPVMQEAMNAKQHPNIEYRLAEMTLKEPHAAGAPFEFDTKGMLVVNGVTNTVAMPIRIESAGADKLKITGKVPLKMTDYKVTPPVKLLVFKTSDDMTISFEWVIGKLPTPKAP
jgi:hypothetical protein